MKRTLGIIGKKLGMTQVFLEDGSVIPVTVVKAGPCSVIQKKTKEKDGYNALQLGFLPKNSQRVNKPLSGHFKKAARLARKPPAVGFGNGMAGANTRPHS